MHSGYQPEGLLEEMESAFIISELRRRVESGQNTAEEAKELALKLGVAPERLELGQ